MNNFTGDWANMKLTFRKNSETVTTRLSISCPRIIDDARWGLAHLGVSQDFPSRQGFQWGRSVLNVHPCEKVIGMFFQNQICSRLLDIKRLCLVCIKRSIEEVKKCQISKHGYHHGPSDESLKKARCQFCDVKFGQRIMEAVGFFDYKMHSFIQITFNFTNKWSKGIVRWFTRWFCISEFFLEIINY